MNFCRTIFLFILLIFIVFLSSNTIENLPKGIRQDIEAGVRDLLDHPSYRGRKGQAGAPAPIIVRASAPRNNVTESWEKPVGMRQPY